MTRSTAVTGVLAASVLVLSGCGGQGSPPATNPATTVTVTATSTPTPAAPAAEVHLFTYLQGHRGYRDWSGAAEYDQDRDGRELELHVRGLQVLAGQSVTVYLGTTRVGTMAVAPNGTSERAWETAHGDQVPTAKVDDRLHLRAENGDVVLSGSFKPDLSD